MKIIQVVYGFSSNYMAGTEVYASNLCRELAKRHKIFVFYRINDLHKKEYVLMHNRLDNLESFAVNNTFRLCNSFGMTYKNDTIAKKFGEVLDQVRPDIVHIQHLLYLSTKIIEEIKKRKIPVVFTLADYWLICPQGQLLKNNWTVCDGENNSDCVECVWHQLNIKKSVFNIYYWLKINIPEYLLQFIKNIYLNGCRFSLPKSDASKLIEERITYMRDVCSKIDLFISPSNFLKKKFVEFGIPEDKIIFLPYGFNLDNFKNFKRSPSNKLRFGFIGNLLPAKGAHILIECFNKIKNDNVELRIYGQVSSYKGVLGNYLKYLKKITKNKNIKFMGGFDNRNVAKIFEEIDILVVPSIWYENSPLVIQEAFAANTPVVASNIGGIPELVNDGINGFLCNPNDVEGLYKKINFIIENPHLIKDMEQNINPPKSIDQNAKKIENIYGLLLNQCQTAFA